MSTSTHVSGGLTELGRSETDDPSEDCAIDVARVRRLRSKSMVKWDVRSVLYTTSERPLLLYNGIQFRGLLGLSMAATCNPR